MTLAQKERTVFVVVAEHRVFVYGGPPVLRLLMSPPLVASSSAFVSWSTKERSAATTCYPVTVSGNLGEVLSVVEHVFQAGYIICTPFFLGRVPGC